MSFAELVFYLFAVIAVAGALAVVLVPNVVHAAMGLILSLLAVAAFYILLSSEFLALVQVLIYGGAVATIILFGLMLTRGRDLMPVTIDGPQKPLALILALFLFGGIAAAIKGAEWPNYLHQVTTVSVPAIGEALFKRWEAPFEIASVVLLVAIIGAIVISRLEEGEA